MSIILSRATNAQAKFYIKTIKRQHLLCSLFCFTFVIWKIIICLFFLFSGKYTSVFSIWKLHGIPRYKNIRFITTLRVRSLITHVSICSINYIYLDSQFFFGGKTCPLILAGRLKSLWLPIYSHPYPSWIRYNNAHLSPVLEYH